MFNIIAFDSEVESWRPELQRFNDENSKEGTRLRRRHRSRREHEHRRAEDGVDANEGRQPAEYRTLHDRIGLPTDGEQVEAKIVANSQEYNKVHARIFTFGVGFDLNSRLPDRLSRENFGQSDFVRPNENIEMCERVYRRIAAWC